MLGCIFLGAPLVFEILRCALPLRVSFCLLIYRPTCARTFALAYTSSPAEGDVFLPLTKPLLILNMLYMHNCAPSSSALVPGCVVVEVGSWALTEYELSYLSSAGKVRFYSRRVLHFRPSSAIQITAFP